MEPARSTATGCRANINRETGRNKATLRPTNPAFHMRYTLEPG
jgi:hypothetical protein